jgi:hypothetical protein
MWADSAQEGEQSSPADKERRRRTKPGMRQQGQEASKDRASEDACSGAAVPDWARTVELGLEFSSRMLLIFHHDAGNRHLESYFKSSGER